MKRFVRLIAVTLMGIFLATAATAAAFHSAFGEPNHVKQTVENSRLHESVIADLVEETEHAVEDRTPLNADNQESGFDEVQLQQVYQAAIPRHTVQSSAENFVDGLYGWLNGEVAVPDFRIDLTGVEQRLVSAAGNQAEEYVAGLPVCSLAELEQMNPDSGLFSLQCRPPQLTSLTARQQIEREVSNQELLEDPVITADTFKEPGEPSLWEKMDFLPPFYQLSRYLPWLLLPGALIMAMAVVKLSISKRRGLRTVALGSALIGGLLTLTGLVGLVVIDKSLEPVGSKVGQLVANNFQRSILDIISVLSREFAHNLIFYGLVYVLAGLAAMVIVKRYKHKRPVAASSASSPPQNGSKPPKKSS